MKKIISWFVDNHVASNLLVLFVIVGGIVILTTIKVEIFPETTLDIISIRTSYKGASPEEIEEGIILPIEDAISGISGIKRISATAREGYGVVMVEVMKGWDVSRVLDDIKSQVDAITTFPRDAERPIVRQLTIKNKVVYLAVYGNVPSQTLKDVAQRIKDEITSLPQVSLATIYGMRNNEIHVEISEEALLKYHLTFGEVAQIISNYSHDLPAGSIRTCAEDFLIRIKGKKYYARDYRDIPIITKPDGSRVLLKDIARIKDSFEDGYIGFRFQGQPALLIEVFRIGKQNALSVSSAVRGYVTRVEDRLPPNVHLTIFEDVSRMLRDRMRLLFKNLGFGLVLVLIILGLFLDKRLAFWVTAGIPIAFLGAILALPHFDVSINMISLFGFIMVLGMVVDDAIIIGENIYSRRQRGESPRDAAVAGAHEVAVAVIFSVLTTVAAFWPLLLGQGQMGKFMRNIPIVVNLVLLASLMEAILILPCHLYRSQIHHGIPKPTRADNLLKGFIEGPYRRAVTWCVENRYVSFTGGLLILGLAFALWRGGWIKFTFFPKVEGETMICSITLPPGTPRSYTEKMLDRIERAGRDALSEAGRHRPKGAPPLLKYILTIEGLQLQVNGHSERVDVVGENQGQVFIQLLEAQKRKISTSYLVNLWRKKVGSLPGVESISFSGDLFSFGSPIAVNLSSPDYGQLKMAVKDLKRELSHIKGVYDITDSYLPGKREIKIYLKPQAQSLGLTLEELGRQVRGAFFGAEAVRFLRGKNEVKVKVRFPEDERNTLWSLMHMRVMCPTGGMVPFGEVASVKISRGYASIKREDRKRVITVYADVNEKVANANEIRLYLKSRFLPSLQKKYGDLYFSMEGEGKEQKESFQDILRGFIIAMFAIYTLLAIPLRSFTQPFVIMLAIPFSFVGAMIGHMIMGMHLTILSMFGMVGLAGVAVNDSLVLTDAANNLPGDTSVRAIEAGIRRFRAVMLTSLTTFFGLVPMIMEKSIQAQFLIPMAVSLGFGILFATFITLLLTPSAYVILDDLHNIFRRQG